MNIEELEEALTGSAKSIFVDKLCPIDQAQADMSLEALALREREAFYDRLLDQLEALYFRGEVTQEIYEQYRASYLFERDGTVIYSYGLR